MEKFYIASQDIIDNSGCYLKKEQQITETEANMLFRSNLENLIEKNFLIEDFVKKNNFILSSNDKSMETLSFGDCKINLRTEDNASIESNKWGTVKVQIKSAFSIAHCILFVTSKDAMKNNLIIQGFVDSCLRDFWTVNVFNCNNKTIEFSDVSSFTELEKKILIPKNDILAQAIFLNTPCKNIIKKDNEYIERIPKNERSI